jgi:hypothetical protein
MTTMFIVGGLVLGLLVFLWFRKRANKREKIDAMGELTIVCPACSVMLKAREAYYRSGPRGDFVKCKACGATSIWDLDMRPAKLKHGGKVRHIGGKT